MYIFTNKNNFQEKHVKHGVACIYVLLSLQDSGFHFLMPDLKRSILSTSFIFAIILSQIFGPKYLILSIP